MIEKRCKDCVSEGVTTNRKAAVDAQGNPRPGNRCVTHWRAAKKSRSLAAHGKRVESNFGITGEQYWDIVARQGGKCFICQRSTGRTRRLAVDHDHKLAVEHGHDAKVGCPLCVRAALCSPCNITIGRLGIEALCRAIEVLADPPARKWLVVDV